MQSFKTQLSENIGLISRHWLGSRVAVWAQKKVPGARRCQSGADGTHHIPRRMPQMLEQHALECNGAEPAAAAAPWKSEPTGAVAWEGSGVKNTVSSSAASTTQNV